MDTIDDFLTFLSARSYSPDTIKAYRSDLQLFRAFLIEIGKRPEGLHANDISHFENWVSARPGRKQSTRSAVTSTARRLACLSSYYAYLSAMCDGAIINPVQLLKRPRKAKRKPEAIDRNTWERLINGVSSPRDKAILATFVASGLRLSELRLLNRDTIRVEVVETAAGRRVLGVGTVLGKGSKERLVIIDEPTVRLIGCYLDGRHDSNCALFLSNRGTRISNRNLQALLYRWCSRLGVPRLHVHMLRHTYAQTLVDNGISSIALKELLGHDSFSTTQGYFQVRPAQLCASYFAAMEKPPERS